MSKPCPWLFWEGIYTGKFPFSGHIPARNIPGKVRLFLGYSLAIVAGDMPRKGKQWSTRHFRYGRGILFRPYSVGEKSWQNWKTIPVCNRKLEDRCCATHAKPIHGSNWLWGLHKNIFFASDFAFKDMNLGLIIPVSKWPLLIRSAYSSRALVSPKITTNTHQLEALKWCQWWQVERRRLPNSLQIVFTRKMTSFTPLSHVM